MIARGSVVDRWRRFVRLTGGERWLLVQSLIWLPVIDVLLRAFGFAACQSFLSAILPRTARRKDSGDRVESAQTAARLVRIAAEHGFYRATCLPQSLLLWSILKRRGIDAALHVGVRKADDRVQAHAWVTCDGATLNDDADVHERFAPFDRAIVR